MADSAGTRHDPLFILISGWRATRARFFAFFAGSWRRRFAPAVVRAALVLTGPLGASAFGPGRGHLAALAADQQPAQHVIGGYRPDGTDAGGVDKQAIREAALVTVRRAILERFPPRPERRACLRWFRHFKSTEWLSDRSASIVHQKRKST